MKTHPKKHFSIISILVLALSILLLLTCSDDDTKNKAPIITSFTSTTNQIYYNETTSINIIANDPNGDTLSYSYQVTTHSYLGWVSNDIGIVTGTEPNLTYNPQSGDSIGTNYITATVSDNKGGTAVSNIMIRVHCFIAGTQISTATGPVNIEDIQAGDLVYGYSVDKQSTSELKILKTFKNSVNEIYTITVDDQTIGVTGEHPFYIVDKGWVKVRNLKAGDKMVTKLGQHSPIKSITKEEKYVEVYNIRVSDAHTYFITANQYLVHNK